MERYICIHGHFYQPPRENPWLEAIEIQDSAYPYHDWNERITAECYAPNSAARNIDKEKRILDIISNYSKISFNFGPTLLAWLERNAPETYQAILDSDRESVKFRSGHGNALAQVYNHIIMPLANTRDKRTQVLWGIDDFESRFGRFPEGMWLSETAVDIETLEILSEAGIKFTILAPRQASAVRRLGTGRWRDVCGSRIDPSRAYLCRLPSGRAVSIFFYDGPIAQAVAFEDLLQRGEDFAARLLSGLSDSRNWPQLLHIATDGETYGHHHKFGEMALAHALKYIESNGLARLTNYGEYLEMHPPTHEVRILENSSWSCAHGIERWRSNCGCSTGTHTGWSQEWRRPLRETFDWLRDKTTSVFESIAGEYLRDPWEARDEYIKVFANRSEGSVAAFLGKHAVRNLVGKERDTVLKLLEMQRHSMLMYTSCGWFFDEISGLETVQIMQYAGRAIQLSEELSAGGLEDSFKGRLSLAKSNIPELENGARIYEHLVRPAMIDLKKVGAHYAISSLFEDYSDEIFIYRYKVHREDYQQLSAGIAKLAVGRISVSSEITGDTEPVSFAVLHFGGHALNGGVRMFLGQDSYSSMKHEVLSAFERGDFADIVRLMDNHFGTHNYSLVSLFKDRQRRILDSLISKTGEEFEALYRQVYENNRILMGFLMDNGMPVRRSFIHAAEETLLYDIKRAFQEEPVDADRIQSLINEMKRWLIVPESVELEFIARRTLEAVIERFASDPDDQEMLTEIRERLELLRMLPVEVNYWQMQNSFFKIAKKVFGGVISRAPSGDRAAEQWISEFKYIGEMLSFNISAVLPQGL